MQTRLDYIVHCINNIIFPKKNYSQSSYVFEFN